MTILEEMRLVKKTKLFSYKSDEVKVIQPKKFNEGKFLRFKIFSEDLGVGAFIIEERREAENGYVRVVGYLCFLRRQCPMKMISHEERSTWEKIDENFFIFSIKSIEEDHAIFYQRLKNDFTEKRIKL